MIQIRNVTKKYADTVIINNANYTFPEKGIVCLMGPSGGGKTTLLNLIAGFDTDYEGEILVGGKSISKMDADSLCRYRCDNIGFVFQNYHLLPGYTVLENVQIASELSEESSEDSQQRATTLLNRLGIEAKKNQKVENLSGGQKQRVAIARALMSNPQILFADEPTGALDRNTSTEIMTILQEIAKDRLVVVITHDAKICEFADEIIHIRDQRIVTEQERPRNITGDTSLVIGRKTIISMFSRAIKNFKVHAMRYAAVSLAISIGLLTFLFSLSFGNIMERSIDDFTTKNTAFNNGYIKGEDDGTILNLLKEDDRIENVYYQYKLENISLSIDNKTEQLTEKFPMPKATESLSYGVMPRYGMNEIAITPSLAKKFDLDIRNLIDKSLVLELAGKEYNLTISGIYNAGYDDFFVSSDVEQQFYKTVSADANKNYSINYDVKEFSDIVAVSNDMELHGLTAKTAASEVSALQNTFNSLNKLFFIISILILAIGLFICTVLLYKLQNARFREVGLLSALGFSRQQISSMIRYENLMLSSLATMVNLILLGVSILVGKMMGYTLIFTGVQITLSVVATFVIVMSISSIVSYKLIRTEPAVALRK